MISATDESSRPSPTTTDQIQAPPTARVIDLCCGLGGLSLAAKQAGMRIVAGVDLNPTAIKTFRRNFPSAEGIHGSVRSPIVLKRCVELLESQKGDASPIIILSGPPCQGFSAAGSRDPKDKRNKVLVAVAQAIVKLKPHCALIENVSMVLAEKHGDRVSRFDEILAKGNYHVRRVLLDASDFGVPQKRKRAFFFITRVPLESENILALLEKRKTAKTTTEQTLLGLPTPVVRPDDYDDEKDYGAFWNHFAMDHSQKVKDKIAAILPGTGPMSYRRLHPTRPSNTLFSGNRAPPAHFSEPRSITVREAARLQGFPDDFRIFGAFSNQMVQVTNAVPPPLSFAVLEVLKELT